MHTHFRDMHQYDSHLHSSAAMTLAVVTSAAILFYNLKINDDFLAI